MKADKSIKSLAPGRENKPHIGIYGRTNSGKSSLLNFITGADTAIVAPQRGTTTDAVRKSYEIIGFAPVIFIDTAGVDDTSELGTKRVARTLETVGQIDLALIVFQDLGECEEELAALFDRHEIPFIPVHNGASGPGAVAGGSKVIEVDAAGTDDGQREALLEEIKRQLPENSYALPSMFGTRVGAGDVVLLVCPIDSEAPAGRLILPQVQAIRELLDLHAIPVVIQPEQIPAVLDRGAAPKLVVTDSQVFPEVSRALPNGMELTSFSILLAEAKGDIALYTEGLKKIDALQDGDRILIAESCTHQVSCEDIGRVKIPRWLEKYTGKRLQFTVVSGLSPLPADIASYALMVQCGGCMVTRNQVRRRIRAAAEAGVPVTNYGMLIRKVAQE